MIKLIAFHPAGATPTAIPPPGARGRIITRATDRDIPGIGHKPYPGPIESSWFADADAAAAALGAPDLQNALVQHPAIFAGVEKIVVGDEADRMLPGTAKVIAFIRRRADLSVAQFQDYWGTRHADLVKDLPDLKRYVQTHLGPENYADGREPWFDGIAELWWPDDARFDAAWRSPEMAIDGADGANYSSGGRYIFVAQETPMA